MKSILRHIRPFSAKTINYAEVASLPRIQATPTQCGLAKRQSSSASQNISISSGTSMRIAPLNELTDEERLIKETARKFAKEKVAPLAKEMDINGRIPDHIAKGLFDAGLMSMMIPEEYGGSEVSFRAVAEAIYEICKADMGTGTLVIVHNTLGCKNTVAFGSEELKQKFLPGMATKDVGAICISEDIAGSDAYAMRTTAIRDGDHYVLNGHKLWISNADLATRFLVFANVDPSKGYRGITLFLVERDTPGFTVGKTLDKLGLRSSGTAPIYFDNARIPVFNRLGAEGKGYKYALEKLADGRICAGVQGVAVASAALDYTVKYINERKQFGQKIWEFQAIQHQVCEALTRLESAKLLIYNAIRRQEAGLPYTKEACMAKYAGTEVNSFITSQCINWMGGVGFTKDYPIEKFYRDAPIGLIYEGTSNIQLNTIAKFWEMEGFPID